MKIGQIEEDTVVTTETGVTLPPDGAVSQGRAPVSLILGSSVFSTMSVFLY